MKPSPLTIKNIRACSIRPCDKKIINDYIKSTLIKIKVSNSEKKHEKVLAKRIKKTEMHETEKIAQIDNARNSLRLYKTDPEIVIDPLKEQIMRRTQGASQLAASLKVIEKKKTEERKKYLLETEKINEELDKIKQKFLRAEKRSIYHNSEKISTAANVAKPINRTINRMIVNFNDRQTGFETHYINKAEKILKCKEIKEKMLINFKKAIEEEFNRKKLIHTENLRKLINNKNNNLMNKTVSRQNIFQVILIFKYQTEINYSIDSKKEKELLHKIIQNENYNRILELDKFKRKMILAKHQFIKELNKTKKYNVTQLQDYAINKNLSEQESSKNIFDFVDKLKVISPNNSEKFLLKAIKKLNKKYNAQVSVDENQ